ncbi:hypothetical protein [Streptacidiphilus sp. PAMC 29251]
MPAAGPTPLSTTPSTQQAAPTPHSTAGTGPGASAAPTTPTLQGTAGTPGTGDLNIVNADYAVQSKPGGTVAVQLFGPKGVPGLQAALDQAGIPAAVMTPSASCHEAIENDDSGRYNLAQVLPPSGSGGHGGPAGMYQLIRPSAIPAGDHLLFIARFDGPVKALGILLVLQVPSCVPTQ